MPLQQHPLYAEGFDDACDFAPLFDDANPIYRAGWLAYWECREILKRFSAAKG